MRSRRVDGESGQSTIEFALTLLFLLMIIFFYVQLGLVMAVSNYVQYATFMAARAYFAAGADQQDQIQRATDVAAKMLKKNQGGSDRWPALAKGVEGDTLQGVTIGTGEQFQEKDKSHSWQEGVRYSFRSKMILLPGEPSGGSVSTIELTSESWLGREPDSSECSEYMSGVGGIIDNGC